MNAYTTAAMVTDVFAAIGIVTLILLVIGLIGSLTGRRLKTARETQLWPPKGVHLTANTANLDNLEAILATGCPLSLDDQRELCVALRRAWDANTDALARVTVLARQLDEARQTPKAVA